MIASSTSHSHPSWTQIFASRSCFILWYKEMKLQFITNSLCSAFPIFTHGNGSFSTTSSVICYEPLKILNSCFMMGFSQLSSLKWFKPKTPKFLTPPSHCHFKATFHDIFSENKIPRKTIRNSLRVLMLLNIMFLHRWEDFS